MGLERTARARAARQVLIAGMLLAGTGAAAAASLVLPWEQYGNVEGCTFLRSGNLENDMALTLTPGALGSYAMGCTFVDVNADGRGNQRAAAICSHEGEEMMSAEDFIIAAPDPAGTVTIFTSRGEVWAELEACR